MTRVMPLEYGCWPAPAQRLLLRAGLLDGQAAIDAWTRWTREVDFESTDPASVRLLPLVYRRLTDLGVKTPLLGRLRGLYRQAWYKNQLIAGRVSAAAAALSAANIETVVLKGLALGPIAYGHLALRPMADADLLVPTADAVRAASVLQAAGWRPAHEAHEWPPRFTASRSFTNEQGLEIDLHVHVMHECLETDADEAFWQAAVPFSVAGVETRTLCVADHLLHVVTHGYRPSPLPPIRWIADAALLIRAGGPSFDWTRVVDQARMRRVSLMVNDALAFLVDHVGVDVPADVRARLARIPVTTTGRLERWARSEPGWARLGTGLWCEYRRAAGREGDWRGPLGLARYVRDRLALPSTRHVPVAVWQKAMVRWRAARRRARVPA